jgi:probable rRNA maturation factor
MNRIINFYQDKEYQLPIEEKRLRKILSGVLRDLDRKKYDISVIAKNDDDLRRMKKQYFNEDVYTDIISFVIEEEPLLEGELYYSPERIRQNAEKFSQTESREFARVLVHGVCHLCGFDDKNEEERRVMSDLEDSFLTKYYNGS